MKDIMTDESTQALILMLNAIRLQLYASQMNSASDELYECLKQSARLSDMAMKITGLKAV